MDLPSDYLVTNPYFLGKLKVAAGTLTYSRERALLCYEMEYGTVIPWHYLQSI